MTTPFASRFLVAGLITLAVVAPAAVAQQTLTVGPGQPFPTIQAAINAAAPGDTVLVLAGLYPEALDVGKGIHLVGQGAKLANSSFNPQIRVHDVPVTQQVAITGLLLDDTGNNSAVQVVDCPGPVTVRNLGQLGLRQWYVGATAAKQLVVASMEIRSANLGNSTTVFHDCTFVPTFPWGISQNGGGTALVGCTVNAPSIFLSAGVNLTDGVFAASRSQIHGSSGQSAIQAAAGTVILDPSVQLLPGGSAPGVGGPVVPLTLEFGTTTAHLTASTLGVHDHGGPPGTAFVTVFSLPAPEVLTDFGPAWIDLPSCGILQVATYDAAREHVLSLPVPPLPPGFAIALQSAMFLPNGPALGTATVVVAP